MRVVTPLRAVRQEPQLIKQAKATSQSLLPDKSGPKLNGRHCVITVFPIDATGKPATSASRSANGDAPG